MRLRFLELPADERRVYINEAAARRSVSPVMIEKDFWVCWVLAVLFGSEFRDALVFKGGTSLSKVFGVIAASRRTSTSPWRLPFSACPPDDPGSRTQADKWMEAAEEACTSAVEDRVQPALESIASEVLGEREGPWFEFAIDEATHSPVLLFHYPTTQPAGFEYLMRSVKLEFGSLTDQQPTDWHPVRPWIADVLKESFGDWACTVVALDVHRTFWEKATILHAEYHRSPDKPTPVRFSRHYADTVALAGHAWAAAAVDRPDLRERVVAWKQRFFGSAWARYDLARPPTFKLVPPKEREASLRVDYAAMREMFLAGPPAFDDILRSLERLERRINGVSNGA